MKPSRTCGSRFKALVTTLAVCVGLFLAAAPVAGAASWVDGPAPSASWVD